MRDKLIKAGVRNLRQYGYEGVDEANILTDEIYSAFFKSMLLDNLDKGADAEINALLAEIESGSQKTTEHKQ